MARTRRKFLSFKVKGNIHWVSVKHAHGAEVRLYDRLFKAEHPGTSRDFLQDVNPDSVKTVAACLEPSLGGAKAEERFQFERHGYFVADSRNAAVFNRTVSLRDSRGKRA